MFWPFCLRSRAVGFLGNGIGVPGALVFPFYFGASPKGGVWGGLWGAYLLFSPSGSVAGFWGAGGIWGYGAFEAIMPEKEKEKSRLAWLFYCFT